MHQQSEANRPGDAQLPHGPDRIAPMGSSIAPAAGCRQVSAQSIWSAWSATAMPCWAIMEQGPLYNACDFSWAVLEHRAISAGRRMSRRLPTTTRQCCTRTSPVSCARRTPTSARSRTTIATAQSYGATTTGCYNWTSNAGVNLVQPGNSAPTPPACSRSARAMDCQTVTDGSSNTVNSPTRKR